MTDEWLLIAGMAGVTFAVRYPVLALVSRITLPDWAIRALRYVPVAVLTAIIVPAVAAPDGQTVRTELANAHLYAGLLAAWIAWRTRSLLLTISAGMAVFFIWKLVFAGG
jgi:branched-subunit amino acid transport protein